jgi:hypothetical protein
MNNIWLGTRQQRLAACTVLLMLALGLCHRGQEFDLPHLHSSMPVMPTTRSPISVYGNTASVTLGTSSDFFFFGLNFR